VGVSRKWSEFFSKIEQNLAKLKYFKYGQGELHMGRNSGFDRWGWDTMDAMMEGTKDSIGILGLQIIETM